MSLQQPSFWIIAFVVVVAAVGLDLLLMRLARRFWQGRASAAPGPAAEPEPRVYFLGSFSPILTLLRYGRLPRHAPLRAEAAAPRPTPQARPAAAPRPWDNLGRWPSRFRDWLPHAFTPAALRRAWSHLLRGSRQASPTLGALVSPRAHALEWALLVVVLLVYCAGFLQFGPDLALTGNEAEVFQINSWLLQQGVQSGVFPLWNPYLRTGLPYVSDPMLHIFNPLTSLPILLLGVLNGYRVALFLSFVAAAWGMWTLGRVSGLSAPARLWVAVFYACAGVPVAKFLQGHYLFVFGFGWIPWALAGLLLALHTRRRRHVALAAAALALIFLSGNVYYAFYTLVIGLALTPLLIVVRRPTLRVEWRRAQVLLLIALLAVGLIALQLLPLAEFWPRINKATNPDLSDAHTPAQVLLDLTSTDRNRPDTRDILPPEEYYAYLGWWPLAALLLLPLAVWRRPRRRPLLLAAGLLLLALLWIDLRDLPGHALYSQIPLLVRFRYPTRLLIFATLGLILLAGLSLDTLWRLAWPPVRPLVQAWWARVFPRLSPRLPSAPAAPHRWRWPAAAVTALLAGFLLWSARDVFQTNSQLAVLRPAEALPNQVADWLTAHDPGLFYISDFSGWHEAWVSHRLRYLNAWLYFDDVTRTDGQLNHRAVLARPTYWLVGNDRDLTGLGPSLTLAQAFEGYSLYRAAGQLPYAFQVSLSALLVDGAPELTAADVTTLTPYTPNTNQVEVIAAGQGADVLVILTTGFPGWRVTIDGRTAPLLNVGGYLAVQTLPGSHRYVFSFQPASFYVGLLFSLLALAGWLYLVLTDWPFSWAALLGALRRGWAARPRWRAPFSRLSTGPHWAFNLFGLQIQVSRAQVGSTALTAGGLAFLVGLGVYAFTRLYALDRFPIFFFADETVNSELAQQLLARGFRDGLGRLFPLYFDVAANRWTPLLSVYVHALTVALFGKSLFITRATSALVSLAGAAALSLILRRVFHARYWWTGLLLLGLMPAWFLHSRTAFETVMMCSFYAYFLFFYLLYRVESPRYIYPALLFGAAAFYTYSNGQSLVAATALLLLLSDLRYHWQQRATLAGAFVLAVVLALPLLTFQLQHGSAFGSHLRAIDSYLYQKIPLLEKLKLIVGTYLYALSPQYLFFPNGQDLSRHVMLGYAHLRTELLPFVLLGLGLCLWRWRSPAHRALVLAALAAPVGASLVGVGITRVLSLAIPAALFAGLGLNALLTWAAARLEKWRAAPRLGPAALGAAALAVLVAGNLALLRDALVNGPLWYRDYGLYGMQYGAKQLFVDTIPAELSADPGVHILVSSTWANAADAFVRFFLTPEQQARVSMGSLDYFTFSEHDPSHTLLVLTENEYQAALADPKFKSVAVERLLYYPDGTPGFYFLRLTYVDNISAIFAAEKEARRAPIDEPAVVNGVPLTVRHSLFDAGTVANLFDADLFSLIRGLEANPLLIELRYPQPHTVTGLALVLGSMDDFTVTVTLTPADGSPPLTFSRNYTGLTDDPHLAYDFAAELGLAPPPIAVLRLELLNNLSGETAQIHVREVTVR
ncbi:MAG: glycosyltransferase family 39 protein [Anaerolineales bacterium]|nr:glycosyltransferase family 39 protein [Anaerolineales bacterium]